MDSLLLGWGVSLFTHLLSFRMTPTLTGDSFSREHLKRDAGRASLFGHLDTLFLDLFASGSFRDEDKQSIQTILLAIEAILETLKATNPDLLFRILNDFFKRGGSKDLQAIYGFFNSSPNPNTGSSRVNEGLKPNPAAGPSRDIDGLIASWIC